MPKNNKTIFYLVVYSIFIVLISPTIHAISFDCVSEVEIELNSYEKIQNPDGTFSFLKSKFQPNNEYGFVREGDRIYVEKFKSEINSTCIAEDLKKGKITVDFKEPESDEWINRGIEIQIQATDPNVDYYNVNLVGTNNLGDGIYKDSLGGSPTIRPISLEQEGTWEIRLTYEDEHPWDNSHFYVTNSNFITNNTYYRHIIPGRIDVASRVDASVLKNMEEIKEGSNKSFLVSFIVSLMTIIVSLIAIFVMIWVGNKTIGKTEDSTNKQIEKMDEHHKEQIRLSKQQEEDRQISLLESLYSELDILSSKEHLIPLSKDKRKGNLEWYKDYFDEIAKLGLGKLKTKPENDEWKVIIPRDKLPHHDLLTINIGNFLSMSREIRDKSTKSLKELLILINQKIELLNEYRKQLLNGEIKDEEFNDFCKRAIKTLDETIKRVKKAKEYLKKEFEV